MTAVRSIVAGAMLVALLAAGSAHAAVGDLTSQGALTDAALNGARGVTVSPDGNNVYVAGQDADSLVTYRRDADGRLTKTGCVADTGVVGGCTNTEGLDSTRYVAVSPDGEHVYVSGGDDHAVVSFSRDGQTGALTPIGCWKSTGALATCADSTDGLTGAEGIVVSPDGANVYVAGQSQSTLVTFTRNPDTGQLSTPSCLRDTGIGGPCTAAGDAMQAPRELAIAPDGGSVYLAAASSHVVTAFSRGAGGALTAAGSAGDLVLPVGVAVSPDGAHVYAGAFTSRAVRTYTRNGSAIAAAGCVSDEGAALDCPRAEGLAGAEGVAVAPDGLHVYAVGNTDDSLVTLSRAGGALAAAGCHRDAPGGGGCVSADGLNGPRGVAVSPDGRSVYVASTQDDAIAMFAREAPPPVVVDPGPAEPAPAPLPEAPGAPPAVDPSAPATSITLGLGGRVVVVAGGGRGVQVRTNGTCNATLFQTEGSSLKAEDQPLFRKATIAIRRAGTYLFPIRLTPRGEDRFKDRSKPLSIRGSLSCAPVSYPASDPSGFGTGTPTRVTTSPDPGRPKSVQLSLIDPDSDPGAVPEGQEFRVRWRAPPPPGGGPTVTFDVVDDKRVENFEVTGGIAGCFGVGGARSAKQADFTEYKRERIAIDRNGQADLYKSLAVPGDAIRLAHLHINFNELTIGKDNAGGTLKFDFRAGEGGCGLLVIFNAKPERVEVPPSARVEYSGLTERDGEVTFNLAAGKRIEDLRIEVPLQCRSSSSITGGADYELVQLFTASTIPITSDTINFRAGGTPDVLTLRGRVVNGRVEGQVLASRVLTNGTTDFVSCGATQELSFTAKPGKPEQRRDRDADGVPDSKDRCDTVSDAGNPRSPRDGCPRGQANSGLPSPGELLSICPARGRAARAAQSKEDPRCAEQKVLDALAAYSSSLTDAAVESFNLGFIQITVPALAPPEIRGAMQAFARDLYAAYRLPLRNLVRQTIILTTPPDFTTFYTAIITTHDIKGQREPQKFEPPDCTLFQPPALAVECKKAFRDLYQAVCDAFEEVYKQRYELTRKRLLPGADWTKTLPDRYPDPAKMKRCVVPPIP